MSQWKDFFEYKAVRSHVIMAWCGVFIYPMFGLLDYFVVENWKNFLIVRVAGSSVIVAFLLLHRRYQFKSILIGYVPCVIVIHSLMWMLCQLETTEAFFIYSLNSSTAFIAAAIFLLWRPKHSIILVTTSIISFIVFCSLFSTLTFFEIVSYGSLILFTTAVMTQFYVNFHCRMLERDFNNQQKLKEVNLMLNEKNYEIVNQNLEIKEQKEKLQSLNDLKDKLFMIIAHDFRSPLHSLRGLIMLLNDYDAISPEDFKAMMKGVKVNVDQTYELLENLLIWAKSQMKGFSVNITSVNLFQLTDENIALVNTQASKKNIRLVNTVNTNHFVDADEEMVRLVIRNLIVNAVKFTKEYGQIEVTSFRRSTTIELSVRDNGVGLTEEKLKSLFKITPATNQDGTHKEKGTGLGLMLCKEFIEKNNGAIWVDSTLGTGSTFTFSLPISNAEIGLPETPALRVSGMHPPLK